MAEDFAGPIDDRSEPVYYVRVRSPAGQDIDATFRTTRLEYEEGEAKADVLKLTVDNRDLSAFDSPIFEKGTKLVVAWGYPGQLCPARETVVQKVTGSLALVVEAHGKSILMHKKTKTRVFEKKTRGEIAQAIAKEYGYDATTTDVVETKTRYGVVAQAGITDAQFLKQLAQKEGCEFYVDFDGFHFHPRRLAQRPLRRLTYMLPPDVGDILNFDIENDITVKPGKVVVKAFDLKEKKEVEGSSDPGSTKRDTLASYVEVIDPRTGEATHRALTANEMIKTTANPADAQKEADARFNKSQLAAVKMTLDLVGDPDIVAKTIIEVMGMGKRLSGKYYVSSTRTIIEAGKYTLSLKVRSDGVNKGKVAPNAGTQNQQSADTADRGELKPVEVIDKRTGASEITFKDSRGRDQAGSAR